MRRRVRARRRRSPCRSSARSRRCATSDIQKPPGIAEAIDWLARAGAARRRRARRGDDRPHARLGAQVRRGPGRGPRRRAWSLVGAAMTRRSSPCGRSSSTCRAVAGAFGRRLHEAGVPVTPERVGALRRRRCADRAGRAHAAVLDGARGARLRPGAGRGRSTPCSSQVFGRRRRHGAAGRPRTRGASPAAPDDRTADERRDEGAARRRARDSPARSRARRRGRARRRRSRARRPGRRQRRGAAARQALRRARAGRARAAVPADEPRCEVATPDAPHAARRARPPRRAHRPAPHAARRACAPAATRSGSRAGAGASCRRRIVLLCDISRLDGALRARVPAVPHLRRGRRAERRGVRVRHAADADHARARRRAAPSARSSAPPRPRPTGRAARASATR